MCVKILSIFPKKKKKLGSKDKRKGDYSFVYFINCTLLFRLPLGSVNLQHISLTMAPFHHLTKENTNSILGHKKEYKFNNTFILVDALRKKS